jgi:hypothetical protein
LNRNVRLLPVGLYELRSPSPTDPETGMPGLGCSVKILAHKTAEVISWRKRNGVVA